jgi:hypothetical protein
MIKQKIHKQPISRFSESDYRGAVIVLNPLSGRFISILKCKL